MKKLSKGLFCNVTLLLLILLLAGCNSGTNKASFISASDNVSTTQSEKKLDVTEESSQIDNNEVESESTTETEETKTENYNETFSEEVKMEGVNNSFESEADNPLSKYSYAEIEYARIWLQLGPNQEIDGLYVRRILAGTPLNLNDDTSANYPEDVIQLAGSRLVDGSVTYSGNGDGTINVYNIPLRWDGIYPAGEKFYTDIIKNTKLVSVDTGNDEKIINLIKKMKIE
ncbi:hypothetical protein [Bacillus sp. SM2101]|uniref:hypothetical protein n=1 Tax=Bacillus sp. SM2101 TaxID=2805366 RepID=UPI001BDF04D0|nr:hypothetical protein [Bacillus sp. SM2101]